MVCVTRVVYQATTQVISIAKQVSKYYDAENKWTLNINYMIIIIRILICDSVHHKISKDSYRRLHNCTRCYVMMFLRVMWRRFTCVQYKYGYYYLIYYNVSVCSPGRYGQDCAETCGNCFNNTICLPEAGRCQDGCIVGYQGIVCKDSSYFSWSLSLFSFFISFYRLNYQL